MMVKVVGDLINLFILSSIGIILLLIFKKKIFKRYSNVFNYTIWLFILLRMLVPIKFNIDITKFMGNNYAGTRFVLKWIYITNYIKVEIKNFEIKKSIGVIWIAGIIILSAWKIFNYIYIKKKLINMSNEVTDERILKIYNKVLKELHIKKKITLVQCGSKIPFGIGAIRSYIIIPDIVYNDKEIEWILRHELTHFKYHDILYKMLLMVVAIIYWFDPLVYIMNSKINKECELACDERVLKDCNISLKQEYALTILNSVENLKINKNKMILTALGRKEFIKDRIENMFVDNFKKGSVIKIIVLILVVLSIFQIQLVPQGKHVSNQNLQKTLYLHELEEKSDF